LAAKEREGLQGLDLWCSVGLVVRSQIVPM
jgi:hypothetical protein